ncbi:MAG: serine/threonine protein kinase, partial [Lachnospiraceae bacterium]|nr:serine/threonine protein kinase [Lachnospiraceae bacterium]
MKEDIYCYSCMERLPEDAADCPVCGQEVHYKNAPHQLPAGTILADRYLVGRVLGEGGFGITYIGRDLRLDMNDAVKEYYPAGTVNRHYLDSLSLSVSREDQKELFEQGREKFLQEARTLAKFSAEPSIVCVRDFFTENGTAYIVMEFLEGKSLQQYLAEHGRLSFDRAYEMLEPVLSALDKVHAMGLIHRDISPSNLMLLNNGRVKLLDFGTARNVSYFGENSLSVVYKPGFAPEEQYRSHSAQGPWTDVYAMCATIYKLITGNAPENAMNRMFEDTLTPPSECGAEILPAQERVLLKGMAVRREDRIQSMQELREAFAQSAVEKESVAVAEPDEEDEERTVAGPSLMERKRRTPES